MGKLWPQSYKESHFIPFLQLLDHIAVKLDAKASCYDYGMVQKQMKIGA